MPEVPPTLTDPYTAWRNYTGSSTSQTGNGTLDIPSSTESGYSREDNQLGGGFNFDYTPVMSVTTNERSYWRVKPGKSTPVQGGMTADGCPRKM